MSSKSGGGGEVFVGNLNDIQEVCRENKCACTNGMLESGFKYFVLAFQFSMINASTTSIKYKSQNK